MLTVCVFVASESITPQDWDEQSVRKGSQWVMKLGQSKENKNEHHFFKSQNSYSGGD